MELAKKMRPITKEEALLSYQVLKTTKNPLPLNRLGLPALDYFFFHHRLKAKIKGISFYDAIHDPNKVSLFNTKVAQYYKKPLKSYSQNKLLTAQYRIFQILVGTINQFKPSVARMVYKKLKTKVGVLDFSAGWGGRCMGAMSMGLPYIGIDSNTKLATSYKKMVQTLEPTANVKMVFQPAEEVDFSGFHYDLIFTSPPLLPFRSL